MGLKAQGLAWLLALFATSAFAQGPGAVRKQVEGSMLVTGHVLIEPDGSVSGWEIDQREKLPPEVAGLVENSASAWRFEPVVVDGVQRKAKTRMSLRVVANRTGDDSYRIRIASGYFGDDAMTPAERKKHRGTDEIRAGKLRPPGYPMQAASSGVEGTVYLVLKIERDGTVGDVVAEQVNLHTIGNEVQMARMRTMLTNPAMSAARRWTFQVPTTGESAGNEHWSVRVPVDFMLGFRREAKYGQWEAYLPGPQHPVPWRQGEVDPNESPDAMIAGGVYQEGAGRKLLTALGGS